MRKSILFILLLSISVLACKKIATKKLCWRWKVVQYLENGKDLTSTYANILFENTYTFKNSGDYTHAVNIFGNYYEFDGKWEFKDNQKKLAMQEVSTSGTSSMEYEIQKLTKSSLDLVTFQNGTKTEVYLVAD